MNSHNTNVRHLCLIGGGHSHAIVAKRLGIHRVRGLNVTLISTDRLTPYSGMLPGLIAGHYAMESCHIDLMRLCQWAEIKFISSSVNKIDTNNRLVYSDRAEPVKYDWLSVNTGSQPDLSGISGSDQWGCAVKPVKDFLQQWRLWLGVNADSKRKQRIVVVGGGAAGVEVMLAMYYRIKKNTSINAVFTLINASQTILSSYNQSVRYFFQKHMQLLGIIEVCNASVIAIDKDYLYLKNGASIAYDFVVWTIRAGAQKWPFASHLKCDQRGFILVDQYLRSISHPEIFAAGDCAAFMPCELPKAGVYAVRQGAVLSKNIMAAHHKKSLVSYEPQQRFLSLLTTGPRYAVASRGSIFFHGKWVWYWKNYIDRGFMKQFKVCFLLICLSNAEPGFDYLCSCFF